eukprot:gene3751-4101_t
MPSEKTVVVENQLEEGIAGTSVPPSDLTRYHLVQNPTYAYYKQHEKLHGFLSQQFPTIANPAPMGLCAIALPLFVLSMYNAGAIIDLRSSSHGAVMGAAFFYGGICQLLAGMWEFKTGNTLGALLFSSYGGFWMSFAALFVKSFGFLDDYTSTVDLRNALGIYLMTWSFFTFVITFCVHRTNLALFLLAFNVSMTFLMLAIGEFDGFSPSNMYCQRAGGIFGIISAALGWYGAAAALLTKQNSFFTLPVGELDPIYRRLGWLAEEPVEAK